MTEDEVESVTVLRVKMGHMQNLLEEIKEHVGATHKEIEALKLEMAVFKARWAVLAAVGSAVMSAVVSFLFKKFGGN